MPVETDINIRKISMIMPICEECGASVNNGWRYCPKCGSLVGENEFESAFSDVFDMLSESFSDVNKMLEKQVEAIDLSPWFKKGKKPQGRGFSIKIVAGGNAQPKVSIQTFGDVDKQQIKKQLYGELGLQGEERHRITKPEATKTRLPTPKTTEEPKTNIKTVDGKLAVDLELPGVKKPQDIEIKELPSSIEIKAIVGDRAFFKILTKPENKRVTGKSFEKGVLHLEFS